MEHWKNGIMVKTSGFGVRIGIFGIHFHCFLMKAVTSARDNYPFVEYWHIHTKIPNIPSFHLSIIPIGSKLN